MESKLGFHSAIASRLLAPLGPLSRKVPIVFRHTGLGAWTIYAWKSKYRGVDVSEAQEVKQLREENARLKKLVVHW